MSEHAGGLEGPTVGLPMKVTDDVPALLGLAVRNGSGALQEVLEIVVCVRHRPTVWAVRADQPRSARPTYRSRKPAPDVTGRPALRAGWLDVNDPESRWPLVLAERDERRDHHSKKADPEERDSAAPHSLLRPAHN